MKTTVLSEADLKEIENQKFKDALSAAIKNKTKNMGHMSRFINAMFIIIILIITGVILSSVFWGVKYFQ